MATRDEESLGPGEGKTNREESEPKSAKEIAQMDAEEYDEPERESLKSPGTGGEMEHKERTKLSDNDLTT